MTIQLISKTGNLFYSGLLNRLPELTCDRVQNLFGYGTGKKSQQKDKYSTTLIIKHVESNEIYSLYMSYGEWRIGGYGSPSKDIALRLLKQYGPVIPNSRYINEVINELLTK